MKVREDKQFKRYYDKLAKRLSRIQEKRKQNKKWSYGDCMFMEKYRQHATLKDYALATFTPEPEEPVRTAEQIMKQHEHAKQSCPLQFNLKADKTYIYAPDGSLVEVKPQSKKEKLWNF